MKSILVDVGALQIAFPAIGGVSPAVAFNDMRHGQTMDRASSRYRGEHQLDSHRISRCFTLSDGLAGMRRPQSPRIPATICPCGLTRLDKNGLHA